MRISQILQKYKTDKHCGHKYGFLYEFLMEKYRNTDYPILEIGIDNGYSHYAWKEIFPQALIVGIDNRKECMIDNKSNIVTHHIDIRNIVELVKLASNYSQFQFIIDDGSHLVEDQLLALSVLRPFLTDDGLYIIEDVHPRSVELIKRIPGGSMFEMSEITGRGDECLFVFSR